MARTVGQFILERLAEWGVKRIYGYPGDGINGLLGALPRRRARCEFVQTRHEELASFAACAHAKFTGEVGVCMATSGPGAIHLLNGLYDAKLDHQPVVAIVGQQARTSLGATTSRRSTSTRSTRTSRASSCRSAWCPAQAPPPRRPRGAGRAGQPHGDGDHRAQRRAGGALRGPAARARLGVLLAAAGRAPRIVPPAETAAARRRGPQRRRAGRDAGRPGRARRAGRGRRSGRRARRRRGQGAQRPRRAARRPAVRHRARSACSAPSRRPT